MSEVRPRGTWTRRSSVRLLAAAAVIVGPIAAVPLLLASTAGAATATPPAVPACAEDGGPITVNHFNGAKGIASVSLTGPGCRTITLVSYDTPPPVDGRATYPQYEVSAETIVLTAASGVVHLSVGQPACYAEVDLIYGLPIATLTGAQYTNQHRLIDHQDFTQAVCTAPTTPVSTPVTTTTTPPVTTTTTAPVTTTTTVPVTTTTTAPVTTTTTAPVTTTTTVPVTTTVTAPVTTTATTTVTTTSAPVTTTVGVQGTSTAKAPVAVSSTSTSPSTAVLGESFTQPPAGTSSTLPFTGPDAPVRGGVLAGLALLTGGGALVLFAGRTRRSAQHR